MVYLLGIVLVLKAGQRRGAVVSSLKGVGLVVEYPASPTEQINRSNLALKPSRQLQIPISGGLSLYQGETKVQRISSRVLVFQ